ncbi:MAG: DUF2917 domain-containing protein [Anaerolineae bacterium]|jgi:hypothetical protein|nr:DUF2917 domain-containing protein [Anaerolineae bacterium]
MPVLSLRASPNALAQPRWGPNVAEGDEGQVHLNLEAGKLWRARGDHRGRAIICRRGVIWITQEHDGADYELEAGEIFIVTLPGLVLVQALEPAAVTVTPSILTTPHAEDYRAFR